MPAPSRDLQAHACVYAAYGARSQAQSMHFSTWSSCMAQTARPTEHAICTRTVQMMKTNSTNFGIACGAPLQETTASSADHARAVSSAAIWAHDGSC